MRIDKVEVLVMSPGRNFVTLHLTTSDGVVGLGDATLTARLVTDIYSPRKDRQ